jgi:hypothetical protein
VRHRSHDVDSAQLTVFKPGFNAGDRYGSDQTCVPPHTRCPRRRNRLAFACQDVRQRRKVSESPRVISVHGLRGARSALNQVALGTTVAHGRKHHEVVLCLDSEATFEERALITEGRRWL